jgi:RNA polymerase sigma factor (sigma-70 family)
MTPEERFERNTRLAYKYVYSSGIMIPGYTKEDLFQTALLGLWKACMNFDESKNCQFSTYARACIKNELLMAQRTETGPTKITGIDSLDRMTEGNDGNAAEYMINKSQQQENFLLENDRVDVIDAEKLDLTMEEKITLSLREYMTEGEISKLCEKPKWELRKTRMKARNQRNV